MVAIKKDKR